MKKPRNYRVSSGGTQSNCSNSCSGLALRGRITSLFSVTLRGQTILSLCRTEGTGEFGSGKQNPIPRMLLLREREAGDSGRMVQRVPGEELLFSLQT